MGGQSSSTKTVMGPAVKVIFLLLALVPASLGDARRHHGLHGQNRRHQSSSYNSYLSNYNSHSSSSYNSYPSNYNSYPSSYNSHSSSYNSYPSYGSSSYTNNNNSHGIIRKLVTLKKAAVVGGLVGATLAGK